MATTLEDCERITSRIAAFSLNSVSVSLVSYEAQMREGAGWR